MEREEDKGGGGKLVLSNTQLALSRTKIFSNWEMGQNEDQENHFEEILEPAPECCIYRVPQYLRKINEEAYTPRLISIGPLHYGNKELMGMENQKRRYLSEFSKRVNAEKLHEFKTYIENQEQHIRDHYSVTCTLQRSEYVTMVLYDAVFIIELLLRKYHGTDDFLLKSPLSTHIQGDLLLLENQLPYFVVNELYTKASPTNQSLLDLFNKYLFNIIPFLPYLQVKHFTDYFRFGDELPTVESNKDVSGDELPTVESNMDAIHLLPCATKLKKSGLMFRASSSTTVKCMFDIRLEKRKPYGKWFPWFEVNELQICAFPIHHNTERLFRNLMAFEMFHYPKETLICHYAVLMDHLIDTEKDVDLLVEKGIFVNNLGDNKAIAKMFNKLGLHIISSDQSCYTDIAEKMKAHYKYGWNHAKANLRSVYFSDLWTGTATVAATFLLILTLIQTVCSIMQL